MKHKKEFFHINSPEELKIINNINFTPREIDVMACLVSARGTSKISSFLSIAPKTVVNHIHNLMLKIGCNSREGIIDFVEKSNRQLPLRAHYSQLLLDVEFKKSLKKIAKLIHKPLPCYLVFLENHENDHAFIKILKAHLEFAGLKVSIDLRENGNAITPLIEGAKSEHHSIYVMSKKWMDRENIVCSKDHSKSHEVDHPIFLFTEKVDFKEILRNYPGAGCIDCTEFESYYFLFFNILKSLLPDINFDIIIEEFKQQYETLIDSADVKAPERDLNTQKVIPDSLNKGRRVNKQTGYFLIGFLAIVGFLTIGFFTRQGGGEEKDTATAKQLKSPVRSDLHHNVLLNRPEIIAELDKHLHGKAGIETVALVGPGGGGENHSGPSVCPSAKRKHHLGNQC